MIYSILKNSFFRSDSSSSIIKPPTINAQNSSNQMKPKAEQTLEALKKNLEGKMNSIRKERDMLGKRNENLRKRRQTVFGGAKMDCSKRQKSNDPKSTNINQVKINVGGEKMIVLKDTLTHVKESRIKFLFNRCMDDKLLRDENGYIFLDLDPFVFNKIIEYLVLAKSDQDNTNTIVKSNLSEIDQEKVDLYLDYFGLCEAHNHQGTVHQIPHLMNLTHLTETL